MNMTSSTSCRTPGPESASSPQGPESASSPQSESTRSKRSSDPSYFPGSSRKSDKGTVRKGLATVHLGLFSILASHGADHSVPVEAGNEADVSNKLLNSALSPTTALTTLEDASVLSPLGTTSSVSETTMPQTVNGDSKTATISISSAFNGMSSILAIQQPWLHIFPKNIVAPAFSTSLPAPGTRVESTTQLAYCSVLLHNHQSHTTANRTLDNPLTPSQQAWLDAILQDGEERKRENASIG